MALLIGFEPEGLDPKTVNALDNLIAPLQTWAGKVDGLNTAERLNELTSGIASISGVPTGVGFVWFTNTAPSGYVLCDGAAISRTTYATLFALWGVTWGAGNGTTTFNVPDLRQRFPLGKAASGTAATLAGTGGAIDHTHTGPSHTHTGPSHTHTGPSHTHGSGSYDVSGNTSDATLETSEVQSGTGKFVTDDGVHSHSGAGLGVTGTSGSGGTGDTGASGTGDTGASGTGATGSNNPPYLVVNYIIKT